MGNRKTLPEEPEDWSNRSVEDFRKYVKNKAVRHIYEIEQSDKIGIVFTNNSWITVTNKTIRDAYIYYSGTNEKFRHNLREIYFNMIWLREQAEQDISSYNSLNT